MRTVQPYSRLLKSAVASAFTLAVCLFAKPISAQTGTQLKTQPGTAPTSSRTPVRTPVLVELFTSEGCSSCPPADALLARLQREQPVAAADILVLEEHVDYWDSLGWHDRFSSHQLTDRQNLYRQRMNLDSVYTPQMVVDGTNQFVGNDSAYALRAIAHAAHTPKLALMLSPLTLDGNHIAGSISSAGPNLSQALPQADLYAALVESMASTNVLHGENGGRTLQHVSVVRSMHRIGSLEALARNPAPFNLDIPKDIPKDSALGTLRIVVFAQRSGQGEVLAASTSMPATARRFAESPTVVKPPSLLTPK